MSLASATPIDAASLIGASAACSDVVSISFYGRATDGTAITLDIDDATFLNMSNANARVFLAFLGVEPGAHLVGEITVPEARRAIIRARATFERRVGAYTRESSDTKRPGKVRVIEGGIADDYFERRLDDFESFLGVAVERGATSIWWG